MTASTLLASQPGRARRAALAASAAVTTLAWCAAAHALPAVGTAGGVVVGSATINSPTSSLETVSQSSQRAIIQWQSFNVGTGETIQFVQPNTTAITFNVIPFQFNNPANIQGNITANGGVWLYSPRGVIIGGGAQIDVGSLLITTGTTNYDLSGNFPTGSPLMTSNSIPIFGATASIDVQTKAAITANNGFVLLNSEALTQNGIVTATDGVAYVVGDTANVTFEDNDGGSLILDSVDVSGSNPGEPALKHGGVTAGAWVGVYAPDSVLEGFSSVINMGGTTEATSVAPSGAANTAVLLVGSSVGPQGFNNSFTDVNTSGGTIIADNAGVSINAGQAELGNITAPSPFGTITVEAGGDPSVPEGPNSNPGAITLNFFATLAAGGQVYLGSHLGPVNLQFGSTIQSDSAGVGEGGVYIEGQSVNADPNSTIYTGKSQTQLKDDVTIEADGGSLQSGTIDGLNVFLQARGSGFTGPDSTNAGESPGSDLTIAGNINAGSSITGVSAFGNVTVNPGVTLTSLGTGTVSSGTVSVTLSANNNLDIEGSVIGSGSVSLSATNGNVTIGTNPNNPGNPQSVLIQSDAGGFDSESGSGTLTVTAGGSVDAYGGSELRGGQSAATPTDPVTVTTQDGNLTIGMVNGSDVTLTTAEGDDLTVNGAVYGSNSVTFDPANVTLNADVTSGGTLDINASSSITVSAGVTVRSDSFGNGGGTLTLEAPTITADATSLLVAGPVAGSPTADVSATADTGDLTVGQVSGDNVTLTSGISDVGGNVKVLGNVLGTQSVNISAVNGGVDIEANVINGGSGSVTISAAKDVDIGLTAKNVLIQADAVDEGGANLTITAGGKVDAAADSELRGGKSATVPTDPVTVTANGGNITTGKIEGSDVELTTDSDITVNGAILGTNTVKFDPFNITLNANVTSGGTLSIVATNTVTIAAGVIVTSAGNMVVEGASIDADATSLLVAGKDQNDPTASVTVTADTGDLTLGQVSGTTVKVIDGAPVNPDCDVDCGPFGGDLTLGGAILATNSVTVTAFNGSIDVEANVISDGDVKMDAANDITVGRSASGIVIQSDAGGEGGGSIQLTAGSFYLAADDSELRGGDDALNPIDPVTVIANGGGLTSGKIEATDVTLITGDDLTINGAIYGADSVTFDPAELFPTNVFINADVTSGGILDITATDEVDVAAGVTVQSAGDLTIQAGTKVVADATSLLTSTSGGAVSVTGATGNVTVGQVASTESISLVSGAKNSEVGGDVTVLGNVQAGSDITVTSYAGDIDVEANLVSGGVVALNAAFDIDVGLNTGNVLIQSDSGGTGAGTLTLTAGGLVDAAATSELLAGATATNPADSVIVTANGGDLTSGRVVGTDVTLTTDNDLTINGAVYGSKSVTFDPANVFINADVTSGGNLDITATNTITVSAGVTLRSDNNGAGTGNLTLTAADISADATSSMIAGTNSKAPTANVSATTLAGNLSLGAVSGKVDTFTAAGTLTLAGAVLGTTSVTATSTSDTEIDNAVVSGGPASFTATGDFLLNNDASVTAAGAVTITGGSVTLNFDSTVRSDSGGASPATSGVTIDAHGDYTADPQSLVVGGASTSAPTAVVSITAGDNKAGHGGNLNSGRTDGAKVTLIAMGATDHESGNGNLVIEGATLGSQGVFAYSNPGDNGSLPGSVTVSANVTSNGIIDIRSMGTGTLALDTGEGVGPTLVSSSGGEVYMLANANNLSVGSNVQITGVSMDLVSFGQLSLASSATLTTTGSSTAPTWPLVPQTVVPGSGGAAPTVTSLNLQAETVNLAGQVTAGKSGARDDIYITALGAPSLVTVGGASGPAGFDLTSTQFANLTGRNVVVMAGAGEGGAHNANLTLASLTLDSSKIAGLWLGTSSDKTIAVSGVVTGPGVNLQLGFAVDPTNVLGGYIPGEIDITGSIGSEISPLSNVGMIARNNIFMGTAGFITAAQGDANFDAVTQSKNFTGLAQGFVFVGATNLELAAQGRIIQQNTSTLTGQGQQLFAGLAIGAPTAQNPLIVAPSGLTGMTIGVEGWTANYAAGPTKIDLFGVIHQSNSSVVSGVDAALQPHLLDTAIHTSNAYRINTCIFGTDCTVSTTPPTNPFEEVKDTQSFQPPLDPSQDYVPPPTTTFSFDMVLSDTTDEDKLKTGSPVTESGNGDLWNGPEGTCPPGSDPKCPTN